MKCPRCWTEKAYARRVPLIQAALLSLLLRVPMKCQHCYHKFTVSWFATLGKQIDVPQIRIVSVGQDSGPSVAAQHYATMRSSSPADDAMAELQTYAES